MSEDYGRRVRDLLPGKLQRADQLIRDQFHAEPGVKEASVPGFIWHVLGSRATERLLDALDCDVFEIIAGAWAKAQELREYSDPAKHPADEESTEFLGEHTLVAKVHPIVEIGLRGYGKTRLRFTLELSAKIKTAELRILGGAIVAVGAGEALVAAQLKYRDVNLHDKIESVSTKISKPLLLRPGLAIG